MKLAIIGYGRMGQAVETVAVQRGHQITARLDGDANRGGAGISTDTLAGARVAIDFTSPDSVLENVRRAAGLGVTVVVGTTGWERDRPAVEALVRDAGTGLLHAPNFSVGVLIFTRLVEAAARMLNRVEEYDIYLWEAHHRHKIDHPGGTARRLADLLVREIDRKDDWTTVIPDGAPLDHRTLQVSVQRVGELAGVHEIGVEGPNDQIRLRHEARNRLGFAQGAVMAAEWMENRSGIYTMSDLMTHLLDDTDGGSLDEPD